MLALVFPVFQTTEIRHLMWVSGAEVGQSKGS